MSDDYYKGYKDGIMAINNAETLGASGDPKGEAGAAKPGLDNISLVAQYYEGAAMKQGADTYGAYNWCDHPMKASTYYNAILRHLNAWWLGEDLDLKSGLPHMAHIRASAGILIDQQETDRMIDDRPKMLAPLHPVWEKIEKALNPKITKLAPFLEGGTAGVLGDENNILATPAIPDEMQALCDEVKSIKPNDEQ